MEEPESADHRLAIRLKSIRVERGLTLDALAAESGISRATLSRLEAAEVSPTAHVLGKLCSVYGLSMSRLMQMVEQSSAALVRLAEQPLWADQKTGFERRQVSPPAQDLAGEVIACTLKAGTVIDYDKPSRAGPEHHVVLQKGRLLLTVDGETHDLKPGDCLRFHLRGSTRFETPANSGATYMIFMTA